MTALLSTAAANLTATAALHNGPDGDGWFPWFPLIPLFFFGLWVLFFVLIARRWRGGWGGRPGPSAEDLLAQRYARGEIDETEFRTRRAVLRSKD